MAERADDDAAPGPHGAVRAAGEPPGNAAYAWDAFDSESYFQHYYGEPHADDDVAIRHACAAIAQAEPTGALLRIVDVGTGPNLFPLMCALPRAAAITAAEFSPSNCAWLRRELAGDGERPQWRHFWQVARAASPDAAALPDNPIERLRAIVEVREQSVYTLPERQWDAATMFFCAESITNRFDEFELACRRFARAARPGGKLVAAFLVGSSGYEVAARPFPVLDVSEDDIRRVFAATARDVETTRIGIVEREIRSGYSGMVLLTATAAG